MSRQPVSTHFTTSSDGTQIGYLRQGSGPGLILIQGAMGTAYNFSSLSTLLSSSFTVYSPDRRGRGLSPLSYSESHEIARDVEDIEALLIATKSTKIFGLSSGGMIALEIAKTLPSKFPELNLEIAIFEPLFYPSTGPLSFSQLKPSFLQLDQEVVEGRHSEAMITAMINAHMGPPFLHYLPRFILVGIAGLGLKLDGWWSSKEPYAKLEELVPALRYDCKIIGEMNERGIEDYVSVGKEKNLKALLMRGTKSPPMLQDSVVRLEEVMKGSNVKSVALEGLDHGAAWNESRGGKPEGVAEALKEFFSVE